MSPDAPPPGPWLPLAAGLVLLAAVPLVLAANDRIGIAGFIEVILMPAAFGLWLCGTAMARRPGRRR